MTDFFSAVFLGSAPFLRYAFIAGLISSIPFGIIGTYVVVKRMSYIAGAVSHSALGGIGLALFLSSTYNLSFTTPMLGAAVFAIINGLIISYAIISGQGRVDTVIGAIWAIGMAIGLIFMAITPGYVDPMSYLFGNILLITQLDLTLILLLNIVVLLFSILFFNQLLAVSFDAEFAKIRGLNTALFQTMLILLISITVLLMITIVGIVMVIALLTIPPAVAGLFTRRIKSMILLSSLLCALFMTTGLFASYLLQLPTGSVTILLAGIVYLLSLGATKLLKKS
ncbi:MAG: metal ABC transporter permease [Candidatus Cloacimonadales bacterium]